MSDCSICLSLLKDPAKLGGKYPGHVYCGECLADYVNNSEGKELASTCPSCRSVFYTSIPDLSYLPKKYHQYVLPHARRIFVDTSTPDFLDSLKKEVAALKERVAETQANHETIHQKYEQAKAEARNALAKQKSLESLLFKARNESHSWKSQYNGLKALEPRSYCRILSSYTNFDDMGLKAELLYGIYASEFTCPSAVQRHAIVRIIKGHDTIIQGQPGTGKTTAFLISLLQKLDTDSKRTQALIVAPTRRLAFQIQRLVVVLSAYMNIKCHACVGRTDVWEDIAELRRGVHVVVGTLGRVRDLIDRRELKIGGITTFCLDGADEMLDLLEGPIYNVYQRFPNSQVVFLTATMPEELAEALTMFMFDAHHVFVEGDGLMLEDG